MLLGLMHDTLSHAGDMYKMEHSQKSHKFIKGGAIDR